MVLNNGENNWGFYDRDIKDTSEEYYYDINVYNSSCDDINNNINYKIMVYCNYVIE